MYKVQGRKQLGEIIQINGIGPIKINAFFLVYMIRLGFPGGKESACNVGDLSSIPGSGRSPGEGYGNPLQCSCLENPMDRGTWQAM